MKSLFEQAFLQVNVGMLVIDKDYNITLCNHFISDYSKKSIEDITNHNLFEVYPYLPETWLKRRINNIFLLKNSSFISWEQRATVFDFSSSRPITGNNNKMIQNCSLLPIVDSDRKVTHVCITVDDATSTATNHVQLKRTFKRLNEEKKAQQALIAKLEETKNQLLQSEKMASIGQLAAGVAHEINNPIGFIKSNFNSLKRYASDLHQATKAYHELLEKVEDSQVCQNIDHINEEYDVDFVTEDITNLLTESFDGISRIEDIVKSLKHFSRADTNEWEKADINAGIDSTLKVVSHELKYIANIQKNYGELPAVECLPMQVNQVLMNLLVNAGQAIDDESEAQGEISITTKHQNNQVIISIADNGKGISEENLVKIFDPFFTTKPVGKGTGLGLSLSYNIIQKHSGEILAESELGKGTTFSVVLPVQQINSDQASQRH